MRSYFGINHHEVVTRNNYKLMNTLDGKHYAKIKSEAGDPDFDAMIEYYEPYHINYEAKYTFWQSQSNLSQGKTRELQGWFKQLTDTFVPHIEVTIYGIHAENTPEAKALLPNKRSPFITGAQYDRITALSTLITSIGSEVALQSLKAEIIAFHGNILTCFNECQAIRKKVSDLSDDLEPIRIETAQALFANEGSLMKKFNTNPEKIDNYFDVHSMRQASRKPSDDGGLSVPLLPSQIELLNIQFKGTEVWQVENLAGKDACLFFSDRDDITEIPDEWKYIITPDLAVEIDLNTIPKDKRFVYAANLSEEDEGELNITEIG
jgi:hypothetical protein